MRIAACISLLGCVLLPVASPAREPDESGATAADVARRAAAEYVRDLRSDLPSVRENAAVSLGRLRDRSAAPALAGTLADMLAGAFPDTLAGTLVDALVEALGDRDAGVRREAAKALGFMRPGPANDGRAAAALARALGDRDLNVRFYAAYALGEIRDAKTAGALVEALGDPAYGVRDQAAWALRELRSPRVAEPVVKTLMHENADVPHVAWIVRHVGARHAVSSLAGLLERGGPKVRLRAVQVLSRLDGEPVVGLLVLASRDGDPDVRLRAVRGLVRLGGEGAGQALEALEALAAREDDPLVREAAERGVLRLSRHGSLAAHWSFDDADRILATGVAKDVTGRGTDGEVHGCRPVAGKVGGALAFGRDAYVELGRPAGLPVAHRPFTVSAWVRPAGRNGVVIARGGAFCGFSLYVKDGRPKFGIHRVKDGPAFIAAGREDVVGSWVHLAGVVTKDRIDLHVNGSLAASAKTPGFLPSECGQGMEIGFDVANSPAEITDHFEGVIDEVKFHDAALSADEIAKEVRAAKRKPKEIR